MRTTSQKFTAHTKIGHSAKDLQLCKGLPIRMGEEDIKLLKELGKIIEEELAGATDSANDEYDDETAILA